MVEGRAGLPLQPAKVLTIGVTILYQSKDPKLDIVFIHGFNGHPERTWTYKRDDADPPCTNTPPDSDSLEPPSKIRRLNPFQNGQHRKKPVRKETYWPRDLLPLTVPDARVMTFGYDTTVHHRLGSPRSKNTVYDYAWELLNCLSDSRMPGLYSTRPILFIVHSLGGIIVKEALRQSKTYANHPANGQLSTIFESTLGIVFFGTPHGGADPRGLLQHLAEKAVRAAGFTVNQKAYETLLPDSERLKQLRDEFPLMVRERGWMIVSFRETLGMKVLGGKKVVDESSACLGDSMHETVRDIESDHREMCRFGSLEDFRYQKVASALSRIVRRLPRKEFQTSLSNQREFLPGAHGRGLANSYEEPISEEKQKEMLDLLRFDQIDARLMSLKTAQGKTCRWLLRKSQYRDWLDAEKLRNHSGFFWIKGKLGTGKSITMKFLLLEARKAMKSSIVISFFNARGGDLEKSTLGLYRSLLLQLLEKEPNLISSLDHCGTHRFNLVKQTGWQTEMLKETFTLAVEMLQDRRLVCYIDALDECPEDDVRDMISFFEELGARERSGEFRVCFSSRHYPEISIKTGFQLVLENEQDHCEDINLYIKTQLKIGDTPQVEDIKAEIVRKSSGIFLWVALVVPILNKEHDRGRINLKRRLDEIPAGLHDLFLDILTRDCKNVDEMSLCIQCILFAKRPLRPGEVHVALLTGFEGQYQDPFDPSQVTPEVLRKFILDTSKGLAEITKSKTPTVQFIHESVRDFLLKEGGIEKLSFKGKSVEGQSHDALKRICLLQLEAPIKYHIRYFTEEDDFKHHYVSSRSVGPSPQLRDKFVKDTSLKYPFLEYAVQYVLYHADTAQKHGVAQGSFLKDFPKTWINLYNWLEKHEIRRYSIFTHLLYVLADYGAAALIRIHPEEAHKISATRWNRYPSSLIAALYAGNRDAARALCRLDPSEGSRPLEVQQDNSDHACTMRKDTYKPSRGLVSCLAEFGDIILLRRILESEDMFTRGVWNVETNPLHYASSEEIVELLVEFSVDTELSKELLSQDSTPDNCIVVDQRSGELSFLKQAIERYPRLARERVWVKQTLLRYAAERGFERLAKLAILHANDAVDEADSTGRTAFSFAASGRRNPSGRLAVMKTLHEAHANPGLPDQDENTPLHYAVLEPFNEGVIRFLSSTNGANLEHRDNRGYTALAAAVKESRRLYVEILLAAGADPMSRLLDRSTPLILSVRLGDMGSFRALLNDQRCEPDARDAKGRTALSWCATVSDQVAATMMSALIESADANPNLRDKEGRTALERSICSAQPGLVKVLLGSSRLEPDLRNYRGVTPLGLTVSLCHGQDCLEFREIARLLLATGKVNPLVRNGRGDTLLEIARSTGLNELAKLIDSFLEGGDWD